VKVKALSTHARVEIAFFFETHVTIAIAYAKFSRMPMLYLVVSSLCLLYPQQAAMVVGAILFIKWWGKWRRNNAWYR
jgi:hypothetical protein